MNLKLNMLPSHLRVPRDEDTDMATMNSGQHCDNSAILTLLKEDPIISDIVGSSSLSMPLELLGVGLGLWWKPPMFCVQSTNQMYPSL